MIFNLLFIVTEQQPEAFKVLLVSLQEVSILEDQMHLLKHLAHYCDHRSSSNHSRLPLSRRDDVQLSVDFVTDETKCIQSNGILLIVRSVISSMENHLKKKVLIFNERTSKDSISYLTIDFSKLIESNSKRLLIFNM